MTRRLRVGMVVLAATMLAGGVAVAGGGKKKKGGGAGCEAACAHRKSCGVAGADDVPGCQASCTAIAPLLGPNDLETYSAAACPEVQAREPGFRTAALVARACAHHEECVPGGSAKACLASNVLIAQSLPPEKLAQFVAGYAGWDCARVKDDEPGYQSNVSCVRACVRAVGCAKRGDAGQCAVQCIAGVGQRKWKPADVEKLATADCAAIVRALPPAEAPARASAEAGHNGDRCHQDGTNDCPPFTVCCHHGVMTRAGDGGGLCLSPPVCAMGGTR